MRNGASCGYRARYFCLEGRSVSINTYDAEEFFLRSKPRSIQPNNIEIITIPIIRPTKKPKPSNTPVIKDIRRL